MHGARINYKYICKVHYINDTINAWCAHTGQTAYALGTSVYASSEHLSNTKMKCRDCPNIFFAPKTWSLGKLVRCTKSQGGCGKVFRVCDTAKSRAKYIVMPEQRAAKQQKLRDFFK